MGVMRRGQAKSCSQQETALSNQGSPTFEDNGCMVSVDLPRIAGF